jgi:SAM-dependent methyltransferase
MRPTIMDIGCGSGGNLETLARHGKVFGVEPSETLASRARARGVAEAILQQDARELPECREVDLFTMFDVLEHIEDDLDFLTCLRAKAAHRHQLLISVPACQFLYSDHDRILHHYRRYTRKALRSTLRAAGYRVLEMNYFLALLFPFVLLSRLKGKILAKLGRKTVTVDISDVRPLLAGPLESTLHIEAFLSRWVRFPVGLWLFALVESTADGPRTGASATECHSRP